MKRNILIVGASGLVGEYLFNFFSKREEFKVLGTCFSQKEATPHLYSFDVRDPAAVKKIFEDFVPDIVIAPMALPNVERCETEREATRAVNVGGMKRVIDNLEGTNKLLIFFSSDYVFDGEKGSYIEEDAPNPLNDYGHQKLEIEQKIQNRLSNYLIVRVTGVYGWHRRGKNFVLQILEKLKKGEQMNAPSDQINSPTYAGDIAPALLELINQKQTGIFHLVGSEKLNRVEFAKKVARIFGLDENLIKPVKTEDMNLCAKRPLNSGMNIDKLVSRGIQMSATTEGLNKMRSEKLLSENKQGEQST